MRNDGNRPIADIRRAARLAEMTISRIISWIDRGYDDGVARSNYAMGLALTIIGLAALNVESVAARISFAILAVLIAMVFAWRMAAWFRRLGRRADRRNRRGP